MDEFGGLLNSSVKAVKKKRQGLLDTQDAKERGFRESTSPSWIFEQQDLKDWLSSEQSCVLWIYGTTGLGKSVLSAYLSQELPARGPSYLTAYFFCSKDNLKLQDETQLLLTFLDQIVAASPDAREVVRKIWSENPSIADSTASLGKYIEDLLTPALQTFARSSSQEILFLIDGLNECPDNSVQGIVGLIRHLTASPQSENDGETPLMPVVKVLLTCQDTAEISRDLPNATKIGIYGKNIGDIETYISQMLELHSEIAANFKRINIDAIEYFTEKSSGMFLWVSSMMECIRLTPLHDLESMLKHAPRDVEAIYRETLNRTTSKLLDFEIEYIAEVLEWLCTAPRDLCFIELRIGLALARDPEGDLLNKATFSEPVELALRRCGMFVQIATSESNITGFEKTINLAHETFKQFITNEDLAPSNLRIDVSKTSYKVAATCINYLCTMPAFDFSNKYLVGTANEAETTLRDNHKFFGYATSWPSHLNKSRFGKRTLESKLVAQALERFLNPTPLKNWVTGILVRTFHREQLWTLPSEVERGIISILKWLDYHGIILKPDSKEGNVKVIALEETTEEGDFLNVNMSLLCDIASHVTAEIWMTGNPKHQMVSQVMFLVTRDLHRDARGGISSPAESDVGVEVVDLSNLVSTECEIEQSWREANLGHAYSVMASRSNTREQGVTCGHQATKRYIASLELMTKGDSRNVAQRVWCSLCGCMIATSSDEGTRVDYRTLQRYMKRVNELIAAADGKSVEVDLTDCMDTIDGDTAQYFYDIAAMHTRKSIDEGSIDDLEGWINDLETAINLLGFLLSKDLDCRQSEIHEYARLYAEYLCILFEVKRNPDDLEKSHDFAQWCLGTADTLTQTADSNRILSTVLIFRYSYITRDVEDLDQAMKLAESAVNDSAGVCNTTSRSCLVMALSQKYRARGTKETFERANEELETLLAMKNLNSQEVVHIEANFVEHSVDLIEETGEYNDLARCLDLIQHAVSGTVTGAYFWGQRCRLLATVYSLVYKRTQDYNALKQTYPILNNIPSTNYDFSRLLLTVSDISLLQYDHTGCAHCLDEAVKFASQALSDITQKPHHKSETADYLLVLAEGYRRRFENYRAIDDWDQAVVCSNKAREANDRKWREGDFEVMCGAVQLSKVTQSLELPGIESAIETLRKAVELTSSRGAPARVRAYHQLSLALRKKYEAAGQLAALEESKQWASQAVEIMPRPQVSCGLVVDNLSRIHLLRAQSENGDISDFVEAAKLSCVNIINTPQDNVAHLEYFKTLHEIFEEGGKCGPDAVEQMELAADECNASPFGLTDMF